MLLALHFGQERTETDSPDSLAESATFIRMLGGMGFACGDFL